MFRSKKIILLLFYFAISFCGFTQTTLWSETFSNGCASGCTTYTGPNGTWNMNVSTGANSGLCNMWYISCTDEGQLPGNCGTGCTVNNSSLHVGSQSSGDIGAAYDASQTTNRRAESPNINTTAAGANTITLSFSYMGYAEPGVDRCQLLYSINGGATWLVLENPVPTTLCCGSALCDGQLQGLWTARSYSLPASCNNIANFRIALNWINDGANGTDPSFAIDYITLEYTAPAPVKWLLFEGYNINNVTTLTWKTASEVNNDYFEIFQSTDGINFSSAGKKKGSGNSNAIKSYSYSLEPSRSNLSYYKIKQVDFDGNYEFSEIIAVKNNETTDDFFSIESNLNSNSLSVVINSTAKNSCYIEVNDVLGKNHIAGNIELSKGDSFFKYDISSFKSGLYYLVLKDHANKEAIATSKFVKLR